jgi:hypothetical protein
MRIRSPLLAAGAAVLAMAIPHGGAQAAPKGWQCGYSVTPIVGGPFLSDSGPYYFACYGRSLKETRARARADCRRRRSCQTGACLPLDFTPGRTCDREP